MADTAEIRLLLEQGYEFQGSYSWHKEEVKQRASDLREAGHKARVVYSPGSKYSRSGSGGGWSVYWVENPIVKAERKEQARLNAISLIEGQLEELEEKKAALLASLAEHKAG